MAGQLRGQGYRPASRWQVESGKWKAYKINIAAGPALPSHSFSSLQYRTRTSQCHAYVYAFLHCSLSLVDWRDLTWTANSGRTCGWAGYRCEMIRVYYSWLLLYTTPGITQGTPYIVSPPPALLSRNTSPPSTRSPSLSPTSSSHAHARPPVGRVADIPRATRP